jgi:hypothetical protein
LFQNKESRLKIEDIIQYLLVEMREIRELVVAGQEKIKAHHEKIGTKMEACLEKM